MQRRLFTPGASGLTAEDSPEPSKMPCCSSCSREVKDDFRYCYPCFQFIQSLKTGDCKKCGNSVLPKYRLCFACNSNRRAKAPPKFTFVDVKTP